MKKILKLFALAVGLASVLANVLILIFNTGFVVGLKRFIPESNLFIRFTEIGIGLIVIPLFIFIIYSEVKK